MKRTEIAELLKEIKENFWMLQDFNIPKRDQEYFKRVQKNMKLKFGGILTLCLITYISFSCQTILADNQALLFPCYLPSWISFNQMMFYQIIASFFNQILPAMAIDGLMMTILALTRLQFRILGLQIKNLLTNKNNVSSGELKIKFKMLVEHHNFLMRFVKSYCVKHL